MNTYLNKRTFIFILSFVVWVQTLPIPSLAVDSSYLKEGECRIDVGNAHISDYFFKRDKTAVKVNVLSECFMRQEKTTFWVQLRKKGKFFDHEVITAKRTITNNRPGNRIMYFKETFAFCKNTKMTTYYGLGRAWATINGKVYFTRETARSAIDVTIPCGT